MRKSASFFGIGAIAAIMSTAAIAQDVSARTVVAKVGETEITLGELIVARTQLPAQYAQLPAPVLFEGLVDQLVQQQLLADSLDRLPLAVEFLLKNERRTLMATEVMSDATPSSQEVEVAYLERYAAAQAVSEFRASHLLVDTAEEAAAAKARIDAGEDFADVARAVSTGPTGPNGGDLGWFGQGAMVPAFEQQITSLAVGGVSEPFETQFGWHVATLVDTRTLPIPTLDEVRATLEADLREEKVTAMLNTMAEGVSITMPTPEQFDPALINAIELLELDE